MTQTYFMHYRNRITEDGKEVISCKGGATMAIRIAPDNKLLVGLAQCSHDDVFDRKLGRTIAEGRLNVYEQNPNRYHNVIIIDEVDPKTPIRDAVDDILGDKMAEMGLY